MDFSSLYRRYAPDVHRFALFLSGNAALAEDLTAETFVRALVAQDTLRVDTVKAYLMAIARNLYIDTLRRESRLESMLRRATMRSVRSASALVIAAWMSALCKDSEG